MNTNSHTTITTCLHPNLPNATIYPQQPAPQVANHNMTPAEFFRLFALCHAQAYGHLQGHGHGHDHGDDHAHDHHHGPVHHQEQDPDTQFLNPQHPTKRALNLLATFIPVMPRDPATWEFPSVSITPEQVEALIRIDDGIGFSDEEKEKDKFDTFKQCADEFVHHVVSLMEYACVLNSPELFAFLSRYGKRCNDLKPKNWNKHLNETKLLFANGPVRPIGSKLSPSIVKRHHTLLTNIFCGETNIKINDHQALEFFIETYPDQKQSLRQLAFILRPNYDFGRNLILKKHQVMDWQANAKVALNTPTLKYEAISSALLYMGTCPELASSGLAFQMPFEKDWSCLQSDVFERADTELHPSLHGQTPLIWILLLNGNIDAVRFLLLKGFSCPPAADLAEPQTLSQQHTTLLHYLLEQSLLKLPLITPKSTKNRLQSRQNALKTIFEILKFYFDHLTQYFSSHLTGILNKDLKYPLTGSDIVQMYTTLPKSLSNCPYELAMMLGDSKLVNFLEERGFTLGGQVPVSSFLPNLFASSLKTVTDSSLVLSQCPNADTFFDFSGKPLGKDPTQEPGQKIRINHKFAHFLEIDTSSRIKPLHLNRFWGDYTINSQLLALTPAFFIHMTFFQVKGSIPYPPGEIFDRSLPSDLILTPQQVEKQKFLAKQQHKALVHYRQTQQHLNWEVGSADLNPFLILLLSSPSSPHIKNILVTVLKNAVPKSLNLDVVVCCTPKLFFPTQETSAAAYQMSKNYINNYGGPRFTPTTTTMKLEWDDIHLIWQRTSLLRQKETKESKIVMVHGYTIPMLLVVTFAMSDNPFSNPSPFRKASKTSPEDQVDYYQELELFLERYCSDLLSK